MGCDFTKEVLEAALKQAPAGDNISFQQADLLAMPFEDRRFDMTVCINTLHHVLQEDLPKAAGELARVTKRHLLLEIKNLDSFYFRYLHSHKTGGVPIFPTTAREVSDILALRGFRLQKQKGVLQFNVLSPLTMLLYEREHI